MTRPVDTLITNIDWLLTVDADRRILTDAAIAIAAGTIVAVGKTAEVMAGHTAERTLDGRDRVATPGLVDSHLHSSFQLARGLADEVGTRPFLFERMFPYEGAMSRADVEVSALLAAVSLLRCGVTCFVDPGNYHPEATADAALRVGIRAVVARSAFDLTKAVLGVLPESMIETTGEALDRNRALLDYVAGRGDPRLTASVSFRGLSNSSDELIVGCKELADEHGAMLQTHACFNYSTHDDCLANFGLPEIARLDALGVLDERVLLAHGGWLEPAELGIVARRRPNFVAAPSSSLHNGYGNLVRGRLPELMELGVTVGIGSDHACSGLTDLVQELFLFAGTQKEVHMNPRVVAPERAVEMATVNGARCAGLGQSIGSIEVGKAADVVLFDTATPEWQPLYNPVSNLVYSATGGSVVDVFVAGAHVLRDGRITTIDEADLLDQVRVTATGLRDRLGTAGKPLSYWPVS